MLELEVLVGELVAVDGLAAGAVAAGEVTTWKILLRCWLLILDVNWYTLDHEVLNHSVEARALVSKALLASCKGTEVLSGLCPI